MKKESNDSIVIRIMTENAGKTRDEVVAILCELMPEPPRVREGKITKEKWLQGYYNYGLGKGAPGEKVAATRKASTKTPKAPKAPKTARIKVPAPRIAGDKEKAKIDRNLTVEELNDIRAKNMAKLQAVGRKYAKGQVADPIRSGTTHTDSEARAIVADFESDLDSFKAPAFLKMKDIKAIV
jgi:hypothetical protein